MDNYKKLAMKTSNLADKNFTALVKMFPNAITEAIDENGKVVRAINADVLAQEINTHVVTGKEERYQFTWPDKKKSILLTNSPIAAALRPCRDKSIDFDNTENLYIEGDNLDVLKLLRETYLNRIKLIYIDPPYNTGKDFIYEDNFYEETSEFLRRDRQFDEQGNRLTPNFDSNGRFHTDWLNMIYPRLRVARDLLAEDGVIFISIDDNEVENLRKVCNEIFGQSNFIASIPILSNPRGRQSSKFIAQTHEYGIVYAKNINTCTIYGEPLTESQIKEYSNKDSLGNYRLLGLRLRGGRATKAESPTLHFPIYYNVENEDFYLERKSKDDYEIIPKFEDGTLGTWRWSKTKILKQKDELIVKPVKDRYDVFQKDYLTDDKRMKLKSLWAEKEINYDNSKRELSKLDLADFFPYAKPLYLIKKILKTMSSKDSIVLDFFSGSGTTAHAVMELNAEEGGNRKFIMIQLPEPCDKKSDAYKAGFTNICEIGEERIRRAGKKIKEEYKDKAGIENLDIGFRVLKLDSSNMKNVYYTPEEYAKMNFDIDGFIDNIKHDRTDEDLLFQVILDLGIPLSAKIKQKGKTFYVNDNYLIACFDKVDTELITQIAKKQPCYAVFRDSSFLNDSAMVNFEQVFSTYSPSTIRRVL